MSSEDDDDKAAPERRRSSDVDRHFDQKIKVGDMVELRVLYDSQQHLYLVNRETDQIMYDLPRVLVEAGKTHWCLVVKMEYFGEHMNILFGDQVVRIHREKLDLISVNLLSKEEQAKLEALRAEALRIDELEMAELEEIDKDDNAKS